ncbi:MAG TPA: LytR C-terminal domain-containing protein [Gaiellaceae bacterium]|nr:LytR C-terminal domain-containing protein [Gaiellaceae bacterium]
MEHVQPFGRPFPWRVAALVAAAIALAELTVLLAVAGAHVFGAHQAKTGLDRTRPVAAAGRVSKEHAAPLRARSRVSVLVLNGNGLAGVAGTEASTLLSTGYRHATAADAPQGYARSLVLFRPGWQREAERLAHDAGILTVAPLDGRLARSNASYPLVLILGAN